MLNTKLSETGVTELHPMQLEGTKLRDDGDVEIAMVLAPNDSASAFGYVEFTLRLCVTIGSHLQLELEVQNRGKEPLVCEQALHTHFAAAMFVKPPSPDWKAPSTSTKPMDSSGSNWGARPCASPRPAPENCNDGSAAEGSYFRHMISTPFHSTNKSEPVHWPRHHVTA